MKIKYLILILSIIILAAAGYVFSQWSGYHNFGGRCLDCHLAVPATGDTKLIFTKDITLMCTGCHKGIQDLSHPVDMKPSMVMPANFPLDWKGSITCVTCHPVHKPGFGNSHLRSKANGQSFCMLCHTNFEESVHTSSVGSAHISSTISPNQVQEIRNPRNTARRIAEILEIGNVREGSDSPQLRNVLDPLSIRCLACHDASFGSDTIVEDMSMGTDIYHSAASLGLSHPIGVSYIEAKRKFYGAYVDVDKLPPQIRLFNGLVGCGSCHNPYSGKHNQLVMSNERSALCFACHVK